MTFQEKIAIQNSKIKTISELRKEDGMVDRYFHTADFLFSHDADVISPNTLLRMGGMRMLQLSSDTRCASSTHAIEMPSVDFIESILCLSPANTNSVPLAPVIWFWVTL